MGQTFFIHFMDWIWALRLPLIAVFSAYIARELWLLRRNERLHAVLMFSYFFFIVSAYWLIKPIKKALLVEYYQANGLTMLGFHLNAAQVELVAKEINMLIALMAALSFAKLSYHFKREILNLYIITFLAAGFAIFTLLLYRGEAVILWLFYLFGDFFVTIVVAGFFAFLNDSRDVYAAHRIYGLIVLGGVLGGFFGSAVVAAYAERLEPSTATGICVGLLALIAVIAWLSGSIVEKISPAKPCRKVSVNKVKELQYGLHNIIRSNYLMGITSVVVIYEMVSAVMDYQFTSSVLHFISGEQLKVHFANVYSFTNFISIVLQLFLTRLVIMQFGVKTALMFLPLTAFIGEAAFALLPGLLFGSLLNTIDNAFSYSINQSAKEVLYVPVEREEKYRAKAFIDIFVLRAAKATAVAISLLLTLVFVGFEKVRWLSIIVIGLLFVWLMVIKYIDRIYKRMEGVMV